jgi:hypothetical protein
MAAGQLMGHNKRAPHGAPDDAVDFVHGVAPAIFVANGGKFATICT